MASMRDIKRRKVSIQSTQQITKAMKLVSTVKLQHAKLAAESSKSYFNCMYTTVQNILSKVGGIDHKYLKAGATGKKAVITITSNRGLAGGYNSNIIKLVTRNEEWKKEDLLIYAIGSKGRDGLSRAGYEVKKDLSHILDEPSFIDARELCDELLNKFQDGEIGEIYLAYTAFKNTVSHEPTLMKLLPVEVSASAEETSETPILMNFEPKDEEALNLLIPKYISSLIYGALKEAVASENGARMQAMDSATSNAEEMIDDLSLKYNRARQGSITQELTEIIAGAEAIS
ncbi:ATP synthase F1 subunit gamma [Lachnospiraceae bacterium OttesenSCG-928-D06]|nr:ATP synthase F1 subunit gamma [Lachnospiraceae bacterium OttesenSCG-928-D06]